MKTKNVMDYCKNAVGTVFLLAGAFFVCSTLLSMRAVFADPIAPATAGAAQMPQATRAGNATPRGMVTTRGTALNTRANAARTTVARPAMANSAATRVPENNNSRAVVSRANNNATPSRVGTPTRATQNVVSRANANSAAATSTRAVASRANVQTRTQAAARNVRARSATDTNVARISLQGSAIRGSKTTTSNYQYLTGKLYTGNYSNIIDPNTGLISADAYSNCLESYYTCMDEICTARNASQGRCACAQRTKDFATAERQLEAANEELIKVSGELALLVATGGKDVSSAFQLTDAEMVMNCVSWQEMSAKYKGGYTKIKDSTYYKTSDCTGSDCQDAAEYWCLAHNYYKDCNAEAAPKYCTGTNNSFGFDITELKNISSSSDIMATLKSWADAKDSVNTMIEKNQNNLFGAWTAVSDITANIAQSATNEETKDSLAKTWGYDLFAKAHNDICSRVLDSCFNGIYEACGTITQNSGYKCANGQSSGQCPYNYNSKVEIKSSGDVDLKERGTTSTNANAATCFGYSSTDPYEALRGPVADARRSIMNKYLLDANAACDVYGEALRTTAQNIGYQKAAAQQALQQKRLEFAQAEAHAISSDFQTARTNFNECLSELYNCYTEMAEGEKKWSTARIKTYCSTVAEAPHCYETMICDAPNTKLAAVITREAKATNGSNDETNCSNTDDIKTNTCRNVVTLAEILNGSYAKHMDNANYASTMREQCLQRIGVQGVRNWRVNESNTEANEWSGLQCAAGQHEKDGKCESNTMACTATENDNWTAAEQRWNEGTQRWTGCIATLCKNGYTLKDGACVSE